MGSCIANVFSSITNMLQRYAIDLFLWKAVHVSGGSSAHHQEFRTVYTASSTLSKLYCYLPLSWKRWNTSTTVAGSSKRLTNYPILYIQFWTPDDGRRNRLKHVERFTEINCVTLHLVGYTWKYIDNLIICEDEWYPVYFWYKKLFRNS